MLVSLGAVSFLPDYVGANGNGMELLTCMIPTKHFSEKTTIIVHEITVTWTVRVVS